MPDICRNTGDYNNSDTSSAPATDLKDKSFLGSSRTGESGQIVLFMLLVIPVALLLVLLTVDISRLYQSRDAARTELDRNLLLASRSTQEQNTNTGLSDTAFISSDGTSVQIDGADFQSVNVSAVRDIGGASLNLASSNQNSEPENSRRFELSETAGSERLPVDYLLIVSDSEALSPAPYSSWESGLGSIYSSPSSYFDNAQLPCSGNEFPDVCASEFPIWATQQCFNPALSSLKTSLLGLVNRIMVIPGNRLGLYFTPGDTSDSFSVARRLSWPDSRPQAEWSRLADTRHLLSDQTCALFSHPMTARAGRFRQPSPFQVSSNLFNSLETLPHLQGSLSPSPLHSLDSVLHPDFYGHSNSLLDSIYFRKTRGSHLANAENIIAALNPAICELSGDCDIDSANSIQSRRGNKSTVTNRVLILVSEKIPPAALFTDSLELLNSTASHLVVVGWSHPFLSTGARNDLEQNIRDLRDRDRVLSLLATTDAELENILLNVIPSRFSSTSLLR